MFDNNVYTNISQGFDNILIVDYLKNTTTTKIPNFIHNTLRKKNHVFIMVLHKNANIQQDLLQF